MTYEKRCDEKRWAGISWEELRWDEAWSVKSAVWSVGREECSVKCGVWSVECEESNEKCEVWSVDCEVWSVKCGVWSVDWEECSVKWEVWSVKCAVWSVKSAVRSVKGEVELQMWHVKQDTTFAECTHARAWLAHGACKFYRWERSYIYIYIFKATSAPPRAGTTGINSIQLIWTPNSNLGWSRYQPNIADNILREAPFLAETLLEGLILALPQEPGAAEPLTDGRHGLQPRNTCNVNPGWITP